MSESIRAGVLSAAPFAAGDGATNTPELRFTSGAAAAQALPLEWRGRVVEVTNESATAAEIVAVLFTYADNPVTVTFGAAAADGGPALGRGRPILAGQTRRFKLPSARRNSEAVQFNRVAASGTPNICVSLVE